MNLDSRKARTFLFFSFSFIIVLTILSNIYGFKRLSKVQNDINQIIETQNAQISYMHKMRSLSRERIIKLQAIIDEQDPFKRDAVISEFHELGGLFLETRELLMATSLTEEELTLLKLQREIARNVVAGQYKVIKLAENNQIRAASDYLRSYTIAGQNENISLMDQFILYQNHQNQFLRTAANKKIQSAYETVLLLTVLTVLLTIIVAAIVIRNITAMIKIQSQSIEKHELKQSQLKKTANNLRFKLQESQNALEETRQSNLYDKLTQLPNPQLFHELLNHEIRRAERNHYMLAILAIELDGCKAVDESLGQTLGDALLVNISKRLKSSLRKEDLLARHDKDIFTICYTSIKQVEDVILLCEILINKINQPMYLDSHQCQIGISIGVSIYPNHARDYETLLQQAENSLQQVKKQGTNNFIIGDQVIE